MTPLFEDQQIHLRDYLYVLRKRKKVIFFFFLLSLAAGILFTCFEKILYLAMGTILIEKENPNVVDFKEVMAMDASSTDFYQTQYQMLQSQSLIQRVIEKGRLSEDPYLLGLQKGFLRRRLKSWRNHPAWLEQFIADPPLEDVFVRRLLQIKPVRNSRLVNVNILYPDPVRAAQITNDLMDLFIEKNLENRLVLSKQATELIAKQLVELKEKVAQAERRLQGYKEEHRLVNIPSIREKDKFIQDAKLELVKLQAEESKLAKRYLPDHPERIRIHSQVEGLGEKIDEEQKKTIELSRTAIQYAELEREAESAKRVYQALLSRLEETHSQAKAQASNIVIVDRAQPPTRPDTPRPFLNLLIVLFIGMMGGTVLAFFVEYFDSTVKVPEDIEKGLGLDFWGAIPRAERARGEALEKGIFFSSGPVSPIAESFRALRTSLLFRLRHIEGCRTLLITSPNPEEGKSTVALNLAAAFQQNHLRILLIDADLRKAKLHKLLGVPQESGLTEILEGELSPREAIRQNVADLGFDFLTSGSPSGHPTEILGSREMPELLEALKKDYDILVIDSSPYLPVADVAVLSEYPDALIVVARYHRTDKRHLKGVQRRFAHANKNFSGVVMNQVSVDQGDYYYHQYYYYGYGEPPKKK